MEKMRRKIFGALCAGMVVCAAFAGCGSQDQAGTPAATAGSAEAGAQSSEAAVADSQASSGQVGENAGAESAQPAQNEQNTQSEENVSAVSLADGVYSAEFDTDSSMFRVNEANDGKGVLTVENGQMTIHVSLMSKKILNLYPGLAEDAQKDGAVLLQPTIDAVTYSDGITEEVYGFDIPVPALDTEFDVALVGEKGTWYDHKVSVSNPEKTE